MNSKLKQVLINEMDIKFKQEAKERKRYIILSIIFPWIYLAIVVVLLILSKSKWNRVFIVTEVLWDIIILNIF